MDIQMKDIKNFILGFLMATIIFLTMGFSGGERGSVSWNPIYVKIVD